MTETLLTLALGAVMALVLSWAVRYWQEARQEDGAEPSGRAPWRGVVTLTLQHTHRHTVDLTPETVALLSEAVRQGFLDFEEVQTTRPVAPAKALTMPDEPEQRIQKEVSRRATIARGAQTLIDDAKRRGMTMPMADALAQAEAMYAKAFDTTL